MVFRWTEFYHFFEKDEEGEYGLWTMDMDMNEWHGMAILCKSVTPPALLYLAQLGPGPCLLLCIKLIQLHLVNFTNYTMQ